MIQFVPLVITLLSGLAAVTFISTAGAYASRHFNFRYSYLTTISLIIYITTGYFSCVFTNVKMALIINLIIGFYDATVGWKLSQKLKPNTGFTEEQLKTINTSTNLTVMLVISIITALVGYALS